MDDLRHDSTMAVAPNDGLSWGATAPESPLDHNAKIAALRQQLQLGLDSLADGSGILIETENDLRKFMSEFYD